MQNLIEIHIVAYNEEIMLPFTIAHYKRMFDNPNIVLYDNHSTDSTRAIAISEGCEVITFDSEGMNDTIQSYIKSQAAMNATSKWVLCIDCDEECLINKEDLDLLESKGVNIVQFEGWDIFDSVETPWDVKVPQGCKSPGYYKPVLIRTGQFDVIEFGAGAHKMERLIPKEGIEIIYSYYEYKLLHYKHWSSNYNINRSAELAIRQSKQNLSMGYSGHFALPKESHQEWFDNHNRVKEVIIDKLISTL